LALIAHILLLNIDFLKDLEVKVSHLLISQIDN